MVAVESASEVVQLLSIERNRTRLSLCRGAWVFQGVLTLAASTRVLELSRLWRLAASSGVKIGYSGVLRPYLGGYFESLLPHDAVLADHRVQTFARSNLQILDEIYPILVFKPQIEPLSRSSNAFT